MNTTLLPVGELLRQVTFPRMCHGETAGTTTAWTQHKGSLRGSFCYLNPNFFQLLACMAFPPALPTWSGISTRSLPWPPAPGSSQVLHRSVHPLTLCGARRPLSPPAARDTTSAHDPLFPSTPSAPPPPAPASGTASNSHFSRPTELCRACGSKARSPGSPAALPPPSLSHGEALSALPGVSPPPLA